MVTGRDFSFRFQCYSKKRAPGVSLRFHLLVSGVNEEN